MEGACVHASPIAGEGRFLELLKLQQALELFQKLYPATKFPDGHPDLATCLNNLGALLRAMGAFEKALGARESSVAERVSAGTTLAKLFDDADELLRDDLDHLMEQVRGEFPQFYNEYLSARVIKDIGVRHGQPAAPPA